MTLTFEQMREKTILDPRGCWIWQGRRIPRGYGVVKISKVENRTAHRHMWLVAGRAIPPDMVVAHTCDVRLCINLDHLTVKTDRENLRDAALKGRREKAPMTQAEQKAILADHVPGIFGAKRLAKKYGYSLSCIKRLIRRGLTA